jgi:LacI family transcriptional regulator
MRRGAVTIKDVAEAAGVHTSTVSRALSPATRHLISAEIAERVDGVAKKLGYARNAMASSLRTRRSMTVGVLIPDITNPLFPPMLRGIEDVLGSEFTAIIANTDNDPEREAMGARRLLARGVDGLILATVRRRDATLEGLTEAGVPIVLVNRTTDQGGVSTVVADDAQGIHLMVEHLAELGHRRIAQIAGPQELSTGAVRHRAFREAMRALELDTDEPRSAAAKAYTVAEGARLGGQLLRSETAPTAILTANDLLALGVYEAAQVSGLAVPGDLSVTGFNDMPFVDRLTPPLTTIRIQHYEMGAEAARLLLQRLERPEAPGVSIQLGVQLVVRGSTAPPRADVPASGVA